MNGYKDAERTHRQIQGTEWELELYEKGYRKFKGKPGRNENTISEIKKKKHTRRSYKQAEWNKDLN